jgi:CheY-like chemotaxis protein
MPMVKKVLLIDDDLDDRTLFCEAMDQVAPEVICYTSPHGRKALTQLNNKEIEIPDIILLDLNMPVMSGWQCLSALKEQEPYKEIPVIIYTTSSLQEDIEKAEKLGALCFFSKPPDFNQLKKSLKILARHLQNNSLSSLMISSNQFVVPSTKGN